MGEEEAHWQGVSSQTTKLNTRKTGMNSGLSGYFSTREVNGVKLL